MSNDVEVWCRFDSFAVSSGKLLVALLSVEWPTHFTTQSGEIEIPAPLWTGQSFHPLL
jgi:hypothetical protein